MAGQAGNGESTKFVGTVITHDGLKHLGTLTNLRLRDVHESLVVFGCRLYATLSRHLRARPGGT